MANIVVRKDPSPALPSPAALDPFRMMRDLMRWDPFAEMAPAWPAARELEFAPAFDVRETKDGFVFKADLPGFTADKIEISLTGNRLTVAGKREAEKSDEGDTWYTYERSSGAFTRAFTLPEGADSAHIKAELDNGVLSLIVPKLAAAQPKKISIGSATAKKS